MELETANRRLTRQSTMDELTGLANRRHFDDALNTEWLRADRARLTLSLLMVDIDHFKNYNDHYGHVAGDKCLRSVANILERCVRRAGELVSRYGGEEFVILLPGADLAHAHETAQNCLALMQQESLPHAASSAANYVTISIGVASVLPDATVDPFTLVNAADAAMYRAKTTGRAHYEVADQADWDIDPDTPRTRPGALN
jgi:diguanylate cyclase (GGDEF)-like protein